MLASVLKDRLFTGGEMLDKANSFLAVFRLPLSGAQPVDCLTSDMPDAPVPIRIGCIVEGLGDKDAVPVLVRRIAHEIVPDQHVIVETIIKRSRSELVFTGV